MAGYLDPDDDHVTGIDSMPLGDVFNRPSALAVGAEPTLGDRAAGEGGIDASAIDGWKIATRGDSAVEYDIGLRPPLRFGSRVAGVVTSRDPLFSFAGRASSYRLDASARQEVQEFRCFSGFFQRYFRSTLASKLRRAADGRAFERVLLVKDRIRLSRSPLRRPAQTLGAAEGSGTGIPPPLSCLWDLGWVLSCSRLCLDRWGFHHPSSCSAVVEGGSKGRDAICTQIVARPLAILDDGRAVRLGRGCST